MIRKQVYIESRQDHLLKRLAKDFGITEAELVRQGLDRILQSGIMVAPNPKAWQRERAFLIRWGKKGVVKGNRRWRREDLYDRAMSR